MNTHGELKKQSSLLAWMQSAPAAGHRAETTTTERVTHMPIRPVKRYRCDFEGCGYATAQRGHLTVHKRTHTGEKPYKCDFEGCCYACAQSSSLKVHKRTHTGEKPFRCDFEGCDFESSSSHALTVHKLRHTGEKPFKCDFEGCSYASVKNSDLSRHRQTHTGEKPFKCDFEGCGYMCAQSSQLASHKRTHTAEKHFKCDFEGCGYTSKWSCALKVHKRTHTGEKPFKCEFEGCEYTCTTSSTLMIHTRIHKGEKPFKCDFEGCGYICAQGGSLVAHKRTHTGEKPFRCDFDGCGYASKTSGGLVTHKRTHTGEKPFKCDFVHCGYACAQSSSLASHKRSLHTPEGQARQKKQESRVARALQAAGYTEISAGMVLPPRMHYRREARIDFECLADSAGAYASIDFVVSLANGTSVFLEVDEGQHRFGYGAAGCDGRRMARVHESLVMEGQVPSGVRFLRYNPSAFLVGEGRHDPPRKDREAWLVQHLADSGQCSIVAVNAGELCIEYAYYDRSSIEDACPLVCYDPDYTPALREVARLVA